MSPILSLAGKTAIVTGASRGIGLAVAQAFALHGAKNLILVGRNVDRLEEAKTTISSANSTDILLQAIDVQHQPTWEFVGKQVGNVDILVNAAGIAHSSLLVTTNPNLIEQVVQTNLMGTIWGCQTVGKAMVRQRRKADDTGCIINVSSLLAVKGGRGSAAYAASKAGVLGLTRSLAAELGGANIRVNAIVPGYIETQMTEAMTPDAHAQALDAVPLKRFGTPSEIADAAVFLATNAYANNCILNIDGGFSST
ncbi:hypothetical protein MMC30_008986 [Trapelia coarctata]|nr:hypothetical protein [Trapelia coarctata]